MVEQKIVVAQFQTLRNEGAVQLLGAGNLEDLNKEGWRVVHISGPVQQAAATAPNESFFLDGFVGLVLLERENIATAATW